MRHDDLTNETVAELWHQIAKVISLVAMASGIGIAITAGIGAAWHKWAVCQHRERIDELKKEMEYDLDTTEGPSLHS